MGDFIYLKLAIVHASFSKTMREKKVELDPANRDHKSLIDH